jgi:hypothetical protein
MKKGLILIALFLAFLFVPLINTAPVMAIHDPPLVWFYPQADTVPSVANLWFRHTGGDLITDIVIAVPKDTAGNALYRVTSVTVHWYDSSAGAWQATGWTAALSTTDSNGNWLYINLFAMGAGNELDVGDVLEVDIAFDTFYGTLVNGYAITSWSVTSTDVNLAAQARTAKHIVDISPPSLSVIGPTNNTCIESLVIDLAVEIIDNVPTTFVPPYNVTDGVAPGWLTVDFGVPGFLDGDKPYLLGYMPELSNITATLYFEVWDFFFGFVGAGTMQLNWTGGNTFVPIAPLDVSGFVMSGEAWVDIWIYAVDGTFDLHANRPPAERGAPGPTFLGNETYNVNMMYLTYFVDVFAHPITDVELNGVPSPWVVPFATNLYTLTWDWDGLADPTTNYWIVNVSKDVPGNVIISGVTYTMSFDFDISFFGIGTYFIEIFLVDCGPTEHLMFGPQSFDVTYYVIVFLNGTNSYWDFGPSYWFNVKQQGYVNVTVWAFGASALAPDQAMNLSVFWQNETLDEEPILYNVFMSGPDMVTSFISAWEFMIDVTGHLGDVIGIYNVTVVWWNVTDGTIFATNLDAISTFLTLPVIDLTFWAGDSVYYSDEIVTFFASVFEVTGAPVAGATVDVLVTDPSLYPIAETLGFTGADGLIVPEFAGVVDFGVQIGSDWTPGVYTADATASATYLLGYFLGAPVYVTVYDFDSLSFTVDVLRRIDILNAIGSLGASIASEFASLTSLVSAGFSTLEAELYAVNATMVSYFELMVELFAEKDAHIASVEANILANLSALNSTMLQHFGLLHSQIADLEANVLSAISDVSAQVASLHSAVLAAISDLSDQLASFQEAVLTAIADATASLSGEISAGFASLSSDLASAVTDLSGTLADLSGQIGDVLSAVSSVGQGVDDLATSLSEFASDVRASSQDLSTYVLAVAVLLVIVLIISAVTLAKVFKG